VDRSDPLYTTRTEENFLNATNEVGGWFRSSLQQATLRKSSRMPPTKLVDGSDPLYTTRTEENFLNATNEVGGSFSSFLVSYL
jgi:hypothetical protein